MILPYKSFMFLKPLPDDLFYELVNIYKRCDRYVQKFYIKNLFATQTVWPETIENFEWICDNILSYYNLDKKDSVNLDYGNPNHKTVARYSKSEGGDISHYNVERMRGFINFANPPYQPNAINFLKYDKDYCVFTEHTGETGSKIIIPVINSGLASVKFPGYNESCSYPCPVLLDISKTHSVVGLEKMKEYNTERVLFNCVLKKSFSHYCSYLPRPNGWL